MHTPEPTPNVEPEPGEPGIPAPVPPDMDPVVPVEEPPTPGRAPGDPPPMIVRGAAR